MLEVTHNEFLDKMDLAKKRLALNLRMRLAARVFFVAALAGAVLAVASRRIFFPGLGWTLLFIFAAAGVATLTLVILKRIRRLDGAVYLDSKLHLSERLATSVEILEKSGDIEQGSVTSHVLADACNRVEGLAINKAVPVRAPREAPLFAAALAALVLVLFIPTAYGKSGARAAEVYRVRITMQNNLGSTSQDLEDRGTEGAKEVAREIRELIRKLESDPEKNLEVLIGVNRELDRKIEESEEIRKALEEFAKNPNVRAAVKAVEDALKNDKDLRKMFDALMADLAKKESKEFEKKMKEFSDAVARKFDRKALEAARARVSAEKEALGHALGMEGAVVESAPHGPRDSETGPAEGTVETKLLDKYDSIDTMITGENLPPRFRQVLMRYFSRKDAGQ